MRIRQTVEGGLGVIAVTLAGAAVVIGGSVASAAPHATALTKTHAKTLAKAINFRASDFPGYTVHPAKSSSSDDAAGKQYAACVGTAPSFMNVSSAAFTNSSGYGFSSVTEFVASRALANRDAHRSASAHARKCLKDQLTAAATSAGASGFGITSEAVTVAPVAGLDTIYGAKFTVTFSIFGQTGHLYGYDVGFVRGNAEVSLAEIGTADVPQSVTNAPLAKLVARAKRYVPSNGLPLSR